MISLVELNLFKRFYILPSVPYSSYCIISLYLVFRCRGVPAKEVLLYEKFLFLTANDNKRFDSTPDVCDYYSRCSSVWACLRLALFVVRFHSINNFFGCPKTSIAKELLEKSG